MANSKDSAPYREYATVNEEATGDGYFTNPVFIRDKDLEHIFFSVRETGSAAGVMIITLQFKCEGDDAWTDYDVYEDVCRKVVEGGGAGTQWRAGVKVDESSGVATQNYTSGEFTFGFDW